jgi:ubiquinol-cytochrome c reductase cytochrome b/c1 subunit
MKSRFIIAAALLAGSLVALNAPAFAQLEKQVPPPRLHWSFAGPFGTFNQEQLQRGFKVYREVCSNCHSMNLLSFRNLAEPGGPGFTVAQAAQIASEYKISALSDKGEQIERPGKLMDHFPPPFPNALAAKAVYGVAPPDMSTLAKARTYLRGFPWFIFDIFTQYQEEGPDYIAAILRGFRKPPADFHLPPGGHYNIYFPGHNIAMPPPLTDGQVKYTDGSPETVQQYSVDVAAFLEWASQPHMIARKRLGFQVMIFLIVLAGLLYFTKRKVWSNVH